MIDAVVIGAVDWSAIAEISTAAATLVLAFATFGSVRSANRAARAAERALLAGLAPVLVASRPEDPPVKVGFLDGQLFRVDGGRAVIEVTDEAIYFAMGIRNAGNGIAVLDGWSLRFDQEAHGDGHAQLDDFTRLTRDLYIAPGTGGFWQGAFRDPSSPTFSAARELLAAGDRVWLEILYSDQEGGQRTVTQFGLTPREDGGWLAAETRHWNLDRPNPRT
jgi:hypothetical protein